MPATELAREVGRELARDTTGFGTTPAGPPSNALTLEGEPLTLEGEVLTLG